MERGGEGVAGMTSTYKHPAHKLCSTSWVSKRLIKQFYLAFLHFRFKRAHVSIFSFNIHKIWQYSVLHNSSVKTINEKDWSELRIWINEYGSKVLSANDITSNIRSDDGVERVGDRHYWLQPREETKFNMISIQHGLRNDSRRQVMTICPVLNYSFVRMQKYLSVIM